jgi:hypothetical protein
MTTATRTDERKFVLPEREHRAGCPAERIERYRERIPATDKAPGREVVVTRCIDCGGHLIDTFKPEQREEP